MTTDGLPCGFFTDNLVKELRVVNLDRVTYTDLLSLLPELIDQTPHCEGENKNRFLFNGKATAGDPRAFKLVETDGIIEVLAGSIFGVIVGTEFAVHDLDAPDSRKDLGILVALSVDIDSSILGHRPGADIFEVPQGAKAIVSDWKNEALTLKVAVELEAKDQLVQALFPERDLKQPDQVARILKSRFVRVNARANADIVVKRSSADDQNLVIERLDSLIPKYANVTVQFNPANKLDNLPHTFDAISQFNYHLALHRGDDPFEQLVSLELFKLKRSLKGALLPDEDIGNVLINNDARLPVDGEALYGLDIINRSQHDLFPYLFYFDPSDYSISVCSILCITVTHPSDTIFRTGMFLYHPRFLHHCTVSKDPIQHESPSATALGVVIPSSSRLTLVNCLTRGSLNSLCFPNTSTWAGLDNLLRLKVVKGARSGASRKG
jgi:hypothetical protein